MVYLKLFIIFNLSKNILAYFQTILNNNVLLAFEIVAY